MNLWDKQLVKDEINTEVSTGMENRYFYLIRCRGASKMRAGDKKPEASNSKVILDFYEAFSGQIACSKTLFFF